MTTKQEIINELEYFIDSLELAHGVDISQLVNMINDLKPEIRVKPLVWVAFLHGLIAYGCGFTYLIDENTKSSEVRYLITQNGNFFSNGFCESTEHAKHEAQKHHELCILGQIEV